MIRFAHQPQGFFVLVGAALMLGGCAGPSGATAAPGMSMTDAVTSRPGSPAAARTGAQPLPAVPPQPPAVLATINGKPLAYAAWINLLKRTHGLSSFQQILAVELARQAAEAKGIALTEPQLEQAYWQEVAGIVGPDTRDRAEADRILRAVLARRSVSPEEFRLMAYRNAYLRRIAEPLIEQGITQDALNVEFDRLYGPKVIIRHIQLSDTGAADKVRAALDGGQEFVDLVHRFSQNIDSASDGGLLAPFSRLDPNVPAEMREVAFGLEMGKVSGPIRIDGWTQILKLEQRLPAEPVDPAEVAAEVRRSLKDQLLRRKMQQLLRDMLQSASIQVFDEELGVQFKALREGT